MPSEEFLELELLVLVLLMLAVFAVLAVMAAANHNVYLAGVAHRHALWVHSRLHHSWLHARLHHAWLHCHALRVHSRLHHTWLHAGLHHSWLAVTLRGHHAWLHALWVHARLHHSWLAVTRLHSGLHHALWVHAGLHHAWLHTWLHHAGLHHAWLHHAWLHHTWLHSGLHHAWLHARLHHLLMASSCLATCGSSRSSWFPDGLQMDLTSLLASVSDLEPLVDAGTDAEGRKLEGSLANLVVGSNILVEDFESNVVANVLDVDIEGLIPNWRLACAVLHRGLECLLTRADLHVRVHLSKCLRVASQPCFDHCQS